MIKGGLPVEQSIKNQMMYLAAWEFLKRLARDNEVDIELINKINRKNAETLMCDFLPIGKIA